MTGSGNKQKTLSNLRHDIRTPMNVVKGVTSILAASKDLSPKHQELVGALKSSGDSLFALIDELFVMLEEADKKK